MLTRRSLRCRHRDPDFGPPASAPPPPPRFGAPPFFPPLPLPPFAQPAERLRGAARRRAAGRPVLASHPAVPARRCRNLVDHVEQVRKIEFPDVGLVPLGH